MIATTEQEKINADVQRQLALQDAKFNAFVDEMRDRNNQRAAEIKEMRQKHDADMKEMQKSFYAKMDNVDAKIDGIIK